MEKSDSQESGVT